MKTIFTCLFVSVVLFGFGQQNTFKVRSFSSEYSYINQLTQLTDGSYVGVGTFFGASNSDTLEGVYLLKTDAAGNVLASKEISVSGLYDDGLSIVKTSDGGFVVCSSSITETIALVKYNADLSIVWQKEYTTTNVQLVANKVIQTADDGFMITGFVFAYNAPDFMPSGGSLIKTDALGNVQFAKQFGTPDKVFLDVVGTTDGNYALLGSGQDSSFLLKVNPLGAVLWSKALYDNDVQNTYDELWAMAAASDGGVIITGEAYKPDSNLTSTGDDKIIMVKYNNDGVLQWSRKLATGKETAAYGRAVIEDKDGGYVFAGGLDTYRGNNSDTGYAFAVKTNSSGNLLWTKAIDESIGGYSDIQSIISTNDNGYAIGGDGGFYKANGDYGSASTLYKLNSGFQACNEIAKSMGIMENGISDTFVNVSTNSFIVTASQISVTITDAGDIENVCSTGALPLQLLSFNATLQNKSVNVNWTTANEVNTDYFVVERSANGSSFTALQKIAAKGNSSITQMYNTNDLQPLQGTSYYRLQQVDKDGKTTYSSIVKVMVMSNGTIVISPNPVQSNIRAIVQSSTNSNLTLQVMDMKGNVLATQKTAVSEGRNEVNIPAASLAKGVYILKVMDKGSVQTIRFVKE